jgi:hypothetical protein
MQKAVDVRLRATGPRNPATCGFENLRQSSNRFRNLASRAVSLSQRSPSGK